MIEKEKDDCYFHRDNGACGVLSDTHCEGSRRGCTFRKTRAEFIEGKDRAIQICRDKGICDKCKYTESDGIRCKKSTE